MSEETKATESEISEMEALMLRADDMGIKYPKNIGLTTLREKVNAVLVPETDKVTTGPEMDEATLESTSEKLNRDAKIKDQMGLVRIIVTNMNPVKKDVPSEWVSVGNRLIPTVRRNVPFGIVTHVEKIILTQLRERSFVRVTEKKDENNKSYIERKWVKELGIEVLSDLTQEDLEDLATAQAKRDSVAH